MPQPTYHSRQNTSRYDRLFALIHQAARQAHLRSHHSPGPGLPGHAILHLRDMAAQSLGCAPADQTLRQTLRQ